MNIIKCRFCREPFNSFGSPICPACLAQIDKDFFIVRDYIYDHPDQANMEKIAEATGVKEAHITYLLEDGRLSVMDDAGGEAGDASFNSGIKCQVCGRGIPSGSLCEACKGTLSRELNSNVQANKAKTNSPYVSPRSSKVQDTFYK